MSVGLLFLGGLCVAASEFYRSRHNVILSAGIFFVSAGWSALCVSVYLLQPECLSSSPFRVVISHHQCTGRHKVGPAFRAGGCCSSLKDTFYHTDYTQQTLVWWWRCVPGQKWSQWDARNCKVVMRQTARWWCFLHIWKWSNQTPSCKPGNTDHISIKKANACIFVLGVGDMFLQ